MSWLSEWRDDMVAKLATTAAVFVVLLTACGGSVSVASTVPSTNPCTVIEELMCWLIA